MRDIIIDGKISIPFKIDTGADETVLPPGIMNYQDLQQASIPLYGPDRTALKVEGSTTLKLGYKNRNTTETVHVIRGLHTPLLGRRATFMLQILKECGAVHSIANLDPFREFPELWHHLGTIPGEYNIEQEPNSKPYAIFTPRKVPIPLLNKVQVELKRMQDSGVISPVDKPTPWCSPMVVVSKPTGAVRICVDFTHLNKTVKREVHPIPDVESSLSQLATAKIFSKLDANSGFWQIRLAEECRHLTTFLTPYGRFVFNRLPFGITSAPEVFQRSMSRILQGCEGVLCHMDDVLIFGANIEEHDKRVRAVLQRIRSAGMSLNKEKCVFRVDEVKILGHVVSSKGISTGPEKIQAIVKMAAPNNRNDRIFRNDKLYRKEHSS